VVLLEAGEVRVQRAPHPVRAIVLRTEGLPSASGPRSRAMNARTTASRSCAVRSSKAKNGGATPFCATWRPMWKSARRRTDAFSTSSAK
jgi:hypothetical protein